MGSYLKTAKGLMGALIAKKAFEDEELEFQLQEKERQLQEKEKQLQEIESKISSAKDKWKAHIAYIYKSLPQSRPSPPPFIDVDVTVNKPQPYKTAPFKTPNNYKYTSRIQERRTNKRLVITLKGDKAFARVYKWDNEHWRFVVCSSTRISLVHRVFKDRKRCFTAAKEYIFSRAEKPLPVLLETRPEPGARLAHAFAEKYRYLYQPLNTFYDYKAHEIELRGYTGGDDFDFIYWYTKGVNDAMDDTHEWDIKYNRNLEL